MAKEKSIELANIATKHRKQTKWITWLANKLRRRGLLADTNICAYGNMQIVGKVIRYGNGYVFWSKACAGCPIGATLIEQHAHKKDLPKELPCVLLKNALISKTPVAEGEVIALLPLEPTR